MIVNRLHKIVLIICVICGSALAQQQPDLEFDTSVEKPAYKKDGPRIMFDEAHHNFHTTEGRYKPFVDLVMNDGYRVIRNRQSLSKTRLSGFKILVISNALGAEDMDDEGADTSAFNDDEIQAVQDWVKGGGSLLLIADHAPFGGAAAALAKSFGVQMRNGYAFDKENSVAGAPSQLIFSRENKLLGSHPITEGRSENERIHILRRSDRVTFPRLPVVRQFGSSISIRIDSFVLYMPKLSVHLLTASLGWEGYPRVIKPKISTSIRNISFRFYRLLNRTHSLG